MEDIKNLMFDELNGLQTALTRVQTIKNFANTTKAINDAEKLVFSGAAIALGDYAFTNEFYSIAFDKIRHNLQMLYFIKSDTAIGESVANINMIVKELRNNNLGSSALLIGNINTDNQFIQLTDKIYYTVLEYSILEITNRT